MKHFLENAFLFGFHARRLRLSPEAWMLTHAQDSSNTGAGTHLCARQELKSSCSWTRCWLPPSNFRRPTSAAFTCAIPSPDGRRWWHIRALSPELIDPFRDGD